MPAGIKFACPHCGRACKVPVELAGKQGRCPGCRRALEVPLLDEQEADSSRMSERVRRPSERAGRQSGRASRRSQRVERSSERVRLPERSSERIPLPDRTSQRVERQRESERVPRPRESERLGRKRESERVARKRESERIEPADPPPRRPSGRARRRSGRRERRSGRAGRASGRRRQSARRSSEAHRARTPSGEGEQEQAPRLRRCASCGETVADETELDCPYCGEELPELDLSVPWQVYASLASCILCPLPGMILAVFGLNEAVRRQRGVRLARLAILLNGVVMVLSVFYEVMKMIHA